VILSAFALFNVQLLLHSQIGQPYDPAAKTGTVGQNYTHQTVSTVDGFFDSKKFNFNPFIASGSIGMCIDEFNGDNFDHGPHGFVGGAYLGQVQTGARPIESTLVPPGTPKWGAAWKSAVKENYLSTVKPRAGVHTMEKSNLPMPGLDFIPNIFSPAQRKIADKGGGRKERGLGRALCCTELRNPHQLAMTTSLQQVRFQWRFGSRSHLHRLDTSIKVPLTRDNADNALREERSCRRSQTSLYDHFRTHRSLDKDALVSRPVQRIGSLKSLPILGELHHHYARA
jgi:hypothetical protein